MNKLERTHRIYAQSRQAAIADARLHYPRALVYSARAERGKVFQGQRHYIVTVSEDMD